MPADEWNVLAGRLLGDGSVEILETELPVEIDSIDRNLSAPATMQASITNEVKRLKRAGRPIFEEWNTVLIAEAAGLIRGYTIYRRPTFNGNVWDLDQIGLGGYPKGMPYVDSKTFIQADPLDIFREVWSHLQSRPNGNLGVTVDELTCPVRVGMAGESSGVGSSASGPRRLAWWETTDLGNTIDEYATETPFDWREDNYWDGDQPHCHIKLGYPSIGGNKGYSLVLDNNLISLPSITRGDFANETHVLGAGEGRTRIRGYAGISDGRIRRVHVVDDKGSDSLAKANAKAKDILGRVRGDFIVDVVEVADSPTAPLAAIELGDTLELYAETPHVEIHQDVRVVGKSESPQKSDSAILTIVRAATRL